MNSKVSQTTQGFSFRENGMNKTKNVQAKSEQTSILNQDRHRLIPVTAYKCPYCNKKYFSISSAKKHKGNCFKHPVTGALNMARVLYNAPEHTLGYEICGDQFSVSFKDFKELSEYLDRINEYDLIEVMLGFYPRMRPGDNVAWTFFTVECKLIKLCTLPNKRKG